LPRSGTKLGRRSLLNFPPECSQSSRK
jgi:hypothetical protein